MKWRPSPEKLVQSFKESTMALSDVEHRQMFGYPCTFVNGNMFTGLHQESMIVRLPEKKREELIALGGKQFSPWPGRVMREYVSLPASILNDRKALHSWLAESLSYARSLPAKKPKRK